MHRALLLVAGWIAKGHDVWRARVARLRPLSVQIAALEERLRQRTVERDLLQGRLGRVAPRHRPHYRRAERLDILWHAEGCKLSVEKTARMFVVSVGSILNWRRDARAGTPHLLDVRHPANRLPDFVADLARRIRRDWPGWGTRRIAGILLRMGIQVSRTSVQAFLRRPWRPSKPSALPRVRAGHVVAKYPGHLWFIDFTRVGNALRSVFVGAVTDGYSRKVLAVGVWPQEPTALFAVRLLREAIANAGVVPKWFVTDHGKQFTSELFTRALARRGIRRRYGKVHRHGSLSLIERFWKSFKLEYAGRFVLYRPVSSIERSLATYARWFNEHRPHQGLGQLTPDEVHYGTSTRAKSVPLRAVLEAEPLAGDRHVPVFRLRAVA
jgi:transposase InsO family protein